MEKTKIYTYKTEAKIGEVTNITKTILIKESLLSSILSDVFTFFCITLSFWVNANYIHSRILSLFLLIGFLGFLGGCFTLTKGETLTKEEFKNKIDEVVNE